MCEYAEFLEHREFFRVKNNCSHYRLFPNHPFSVPNNEIVQSVHSF